MVGVTGLLLQKGELFRCLYTFGNQVQVQVATHCDNGSDYFGIIAVLGAVADKRLINLQQVKWKSFQVAKGRITRSKIINGKAYTKVSEFMHLGDGIVDILNHDVLGYLQFETAGWHSLLGDRPAHLSDKVGMTELSRTDIDTQAEVLGIDQSSINLSKSASSRRSPGFNE